MRPPGMVVPGGPCEHELVDPGSLGALLGQPALLQERSAAGADEVEPIRVPVEIARYCLRVESLPDKHVPAIPQPLSPAAIRVVRIIESGDTCGQRIQDPPKARCGRRYRYRKVLDLVRARQQLPQADNLIPAIEHPDGHPLIISEVE